MVSVNNPHEGPRRRGMMDMDRIGDSMNRVLHGAGGESTNAMCLTSFTILFVMVLFFAFTGNSDDGAAAAVTAPSKAPLPVATAVSYTDDLKHPEWHRQVQPRPTDVNLLIIGNATAHYNYLSLVYYLRWGRWFDPGLEKSNLVNEESFDNPFHEQLFGEFHYQTNVLLEPFELCDCHKSTKRAHLRSSIYENRYYHDPTHNNTVTYIHAFGDEVGVQGRLKPEDLYTDRWTWSNKENGLMNTGFDQPEWKYATWAELIKEYAAKINPKPKYAVMEAGGFTNSFGPGGRLGEKMAHEIIEALEIEKIHSFWRTRSYDQTHALTPDGVKDFDKYMCGVMRDCLDMSWTMNVRSDLYWERNFFHEPVHRVFNEELLEAMGKLPEGYEKYNRTLLF
mmetsp:Transcript_128643/g.191703  ORF Transcript_128643/g.191703 Transcript_128643/m.191703 type:complete len:393 (-) Transcript_128643:70-1248(-)